MKKYWNELKLRFQEQLRVVGKGDLSNPNSYLAKRRKFQDIDIAKDFEKRTIQKSKILRDESIKNQKLDINKMSLTELEIYRSEQKLKEQEDNESDLDKKMILTDIDKLCVLSSIKTNEFFDKFFEETKLHPQIQKNLEIIEYHVKHNLPVEKKLLFETLPENFVYEIGKLTDDERKRYRTRRYELFTSDGVMTTGEQYKLAMINKAYENDKIIEMKFFLFHRQIDFSNKYSTFMHQAHEWGWADIGEYLYSLTIKDADKLTCIERNMLEELNEFQHMKSEIMALEEAVYNKEPELILPFPIADEKYKEELIAGIKHFMKFRSFNMHDTILIPYQVPQETFMDRLYKIPGIEEEIKKSEENYRRRINSGLPIDKKDMNIKDQEVIRQVQLISQAIKVEPFVTDQKLKYDIPLDYIEENMLGQIPTDGRILIEEYYKVLYMNNEDPEKYNFTYWENYFKVSKVTLRNIFNHVFFPIPDEINPSEVGKILYFKDVEYSKRRKMIGDMTSEDYQEYLSNTEERPELEEENRLQYLSYQTTATEPRITERTIPIDDEEIDRQIDRPLAYSAIIKEVDEKIEQLLKGEIDNSNRVLLDKDVELRLEEIKTKRIEFVKDREKEITENMTPSMTKEDADKFLLEKVKSNDNNKLKNDANIEAIDKQDSDNKDDKSKEKNHNS